GPIPVQVSAPKLLKVRRSRERVPGPLRLALLPAARRVTPVPLMVPPVQVRSRLTVSVAGPVRVPPPTDADAVDASAVKFSVPPPRTVLPVTAKVPPLLNTPSLTRRPPGPARANVPALLTTPALTSTAPAPETVAVPARS